LISLVEENMSLCFSPDSTVLACTNVG